MSLRELILEDVVTTLRKIQGVGAGDTDFKTTVNTVVEGQFSPEDYPADAILLCVFEQAYGWQNNAIRAASGNDFPATYIVAVRAFVRGAARDIHALKGALKDDIGRALYIDRKRGQTAVNFTAPAPVDTIAVQFAGDQVEQSGAGAIATFLVAITITFLVDPADP